MKDFNWRFNWRFNLLVTILTCGFLLPASTASAANRSDFITQTPPPSVMSPGQTANVSVTLKNLDAKWTSTYKLQSENPTSNTTWGLSTVPLNANEVVLKGQTKTFNFTITAPSTPGTYNYQWRMAAGSVGFGESSENIVVTVRQSGTNNARFVSQNVPVNMVAGENYPVRIIIENSGTTTWNWLPVSYKLGSQNPRDNQNWGISRVRLVHASVAPGSQYIFDFTITAPATPGVYDFQWQMVQEGVEWFGDSTPNVRVNVQPPPAVASTAAIQVNTAQPRQKIIGLGGDYIKWGADEFFNPQPGSPNDASGNYALINLKPQIARVAISSKLWEPVNDDGNPSNFNWPAFARNNPNILEYFGMLKDFKNRGVRMLLVIGEFPKWMLSNPQDILNHRVPAAMYDEAAEYVASFLVYARDVHGVTFEYLSFNEPDAGVFLYFNSSELADILKKIGARISGQGLSTKILAGDVTSSHAVPGYIPPLLQDAGLRPYLGGLGFHPYGMEFVDDTTLVNTFSLAQQYNLPVLATEVMYDPIANEYEPSVSPTWTHAWRVAKLYYRTLHHSRSSALIHFTYQGKDLMDPVTLALYPVYYVAQQYLDTFTAGSQVVEASSNNPSVWSSAVISATNNQMSVMLINTSSMAITTTVSGLSNTTQALKRNSATERFGFFRTHWADLGFKRPQC